MTPERLASKYPTLFHILDGRNWPGVRAAGLLSTSALLDRFGVTGGERDALEAERRPECVTLAHPERGAALVRDHHPISPKMLERCLDGVTPAEWFRLLNGRVFFWPDAERMGRMLKFYDDTEQIVLEFDTARFLTRYADRVELSRINSGSTIRNPPKRGAFTFRRLADYADREVAEVTVPGGVPDALELASRATARRRGSEPREVGL